MPYSEHNRANLPAHHRAPRWYSDWEAVNYQVLQAYFCTNKNATMKKTSPKRRVYESSYCYNR